MPTRISGLGSGLDIDNLVSQMMQAKRVPIDKMSQKLTGLSWQRDAYRDMNTDMSAFMKEAQKLTLSSNIMAKKASMATSDSDKVKITATPNALNGNITLNVTQIAKSASITSGSLGITANPSQAIADTNATLEVTGELGVQNVSIQAGDNMGRIVTKINAESSKTGVKAIYDQISDKFTLVSTQTGAAAKVHIKDLDNTSLLKDKLKIATTLDYETTLDAGTGVGYGKDAKVNLNNTGEVSVRTNSFTMNDVSIVLLADPGATPYTVNGSVTSDVDTVVSTIKGVFDKYNELIEKVNDKLSEQKYRNYVPLTDSQRKEMSESDIELWEDKAKSGLLRGDVTLSSGLEKMRLYLSDAVSGTGSTQYDSLADIGITTAPSSSTAYLEKGKIYIDEQKLRQALTDNPDQVTDLFTKDGTRGSDGKLTTFSDAGIGSRLYEIVKNDLVSGLTQKTQIVPTKSYLNIQIDEYTKNISAAEYALSDYEQGLYSKYAAMESALNKLNSQGSQLASFFQSK
ncbi:flagellar filament capping protein FliD [Paenibacillus silvestris]|nr:flagellar filament capping protein FliD [Paenibacillus silvestris]